MFVLIQGWGLGQQLRTLKFTEGGNQIIRTLNILVTSKETAMIFNQEKRHESRQSACWWIQNNLFWAAEPVHARPRSWRWPFALALLPASYQTLSAHQPVILYRKPENWLHERQLWSMNGYMVPNIFHLCPYPVASRFVVGHLAKSGLCPLQ